MAKVWNLQEVRQVTATEHRLPWMPTRDEWETERNLGGMITRLWEGQELQQLYIDELERRIVQLEEELNEKG
jgi:hypothetical protein